MTNGEIRLTREALYKKVWSKPTRELAKEFDISDVALAQICKKKFKIPKPYLKVLATLKGRCGG